MEKRSYLAGAYQKLRTSLARALGLAERPPQRAVPAAATIRALLEQVLSGRRSRAAWQVAADELVQLGAASLPFLQEALAQQIEEHCLYRVAQVCAWQATPPARQLLVEAAQRPSLPGRAAALRALGSFATVPADAPLFHHLVEEELLLAQHLLHGMVAANAELRAALHYELLGARQRLFGLLLQVYTRAPLLAAQRQGVHLSSERQAQALEALAKLISQPLYRGMQALLDAGRLSDKVQTFASLLGPLAAAEPIQTLIVRRGRAAFSAWTIAVALRQWHAQPATVGYLYPHLQTDDGLIRESAVALLRQLPVQRPAAYDALCTLYPTLDLPPMATPDPTAHVLVLERVRMLKGTALFAETPENVLAAIVPIMQAVSFATGQQIFAKGTLGRSLFIVGEGEVDIFDGARPLATFGAGDFFGELALLDTEPRSATAVARGPVVTFRLDQDDFYDVMEERAEVVRSIMRVLCQRLRRQNEQT